MTKQSRYSPRKRLGNTLLSERRISTGWGLLWAWPPVGASRPPNKVPRVKLTGRKVDRVGGVRAPAPDAGAVSVLVVALGPMPARDRSPREMRLIAGTAGAMAGVSGLP